MAIDVYAFRVIKKMADLELLSEHLGAMLSKLSDAEIRHLEMNIARKLRVKKIQMVVATHHEKIEF